MMKSSEFLAMKGQPPDPGSEITCEALALALSTIQIYIAWHAGVMSAEDAMRGLDREIERAISPTSEFDSEKGSTDVPRRSLSQDAVGNQTPRW